MNSLSQSLAKIQRDIDDTREQLSESEIGRRVASYHEKMTGRPYCPACKGQGTLSRKVTITPDVIGWEPYETIEYAGVCPECNGGQDAEKVILQRAIAAGLEPSWLERFTWETWDVNKNKALAGYSRQLHAWSERPIGTILVAGGVGTGKTHCGIAAAITSLRAGLHVRWAEVQTLMDRLRASYGSDSYDATYAAWVEKPGLLVLDDLGAERGTEWTVSEVENLISFRLIRELPMLITTNGGLEPYGDRLKSRVHDPSQVTIMKFDGADVRPTNE